MDKTLTEIKQLVDTATHIVIIQADNPDGDSLASALALESIFGDMGKETSLYCAVDTPDYLKHLQGWDRVSKELPPKFDLSIIVDTSANILLAKLNASPMKSWVASRPVIVIDHHDGVECDIGYAKIVVNDHEAVSTGQAIYNIANVLDWKLEVPAKTFIVSSVLSDSMGLSSPNTTPATYRLMADLMEAGVNRVALDDARKEMSKMPLSIFNYKADLIKKTRMLAEGKLALVVIPYDELVTYSPLYNPAPLIQGDMLQVSGVEVALVLKLYPGGKITGSIRATSKAPLAADMAQKFGGGGHIYASGFKIDSDAKLESVIDGCQQVVNDFFAKSKDAK
jgi:bifunctional oligoribonuclease and PAP phosphatase NrnA